MAHLLFFPCLAHLALLLLSSSEPRSESDLPLTAWDTSVAAPSDHLGQVRRYFVQFHSLQEHWNPFLSRFAPAHYVAVRAWSDEQRPWLKQEYDAPAVRFFVRRGSPEENLWRQAAAHQRFEVLLTLREQCAGDLWGELVSARRLTKETPQASVRHAARALHWLERATWDLATYELDRALAAPLPAAVRAELLQLEQQVPLAKRKAARAESRIPSTMEQGELVQAELAADQATSAEPRE